MNLQDHYHNLYANAITAIKNDTYTIDPLIDSKTDDRFGITVIIRPPAQIKNKIQSFLNELQQSNPNQYYYTGQDMHITVLSIISCYEGFNLGSIAIPHYVALIQKSIEELDNFEIHFRGITASPSALMIQGFVSNNSLNTLRHHLRTNFEKSSLQQSIDTRYAIHTAHTTVMRFREKITEKKALLDTLVKYREYDFGKFTPGKIELVYNDWYQREKRVIGLHSFNLK